MIYHRVGKPALDATVAFVALVLVSPFLLVLTLLVRLAHGGPLFFRQQRPGLHGRPFILLKLRTMTPATDPEGKLLPDADRVTRLGRVLRSTSLDELPTLWNVIKGDMSLVGPRPLLMEYLPLYSAEQARRHEVKPGITGWAQISGRNAITWEEKLALDVWYVDNLSLALDLRILLRTLLQVLKREGISARGHATMPKFEGSKR